eukprot:2804740-Rhodomonas_salina.1
MSLWISLLAVECGMLVRVLRNSQSDLHDNIMMMQNRQGGRHGDKVAATESTTQSLHFAAQWAYLLTLGLAFALLLMYPQQARTADAAMVAVARIAFC